MATLLDLAEQAANTQNAYQQQKLNDLKLQEYQQDAPTRNILKQAQAEDEFANVAIKKQKIIGSLASNVLSQLDKSNITDPAQRQQFITQAIDAHKPYLQNVLQLPVNDYLNEQQLRSLSQSAKRGEYHPPVQTSEGYLQYGESGFEPMLNAKGQPYMPPAVDVGLRGRGKLAEELAQLYTSGGIDQPTYERLIAHAVSGQPDIQQPIPQNQVKPRVYIDPTMSLEDQAIAQQDWDNYQKGVNAQGGGVPATSGGIKSDTQRLVEKQTIENENKQLNEGDKASLNFATRMIEANNIFSGIEGKYSPEKLNLAEYTKDSPLVSQAINASLTPEEGSALQAKRQFINSVLRKESGAAIGPDEFKAANLQYFPQPGDSDKVKKQKEQARQTAINGFLTGIPEKYHPKIIFTPITENKPQSSGKIKFMGFE